MNRQQEAAKATGALTVDGVGTGSERQFALVTCQVLSPGRLCCPSNSC